MRPLRLELKGFSTFREQTVIDFEDLDLVVFVGPTGSGKSTIIDGIIFALYGSIVRYKSSNLVAPVVNQLSNEARIRLDFAMGSETYTAVRVVRRTAKGATTKEARLESNGVVLAGNARELDHQIEELLGLNFDQFTKTVVLPQGEFARFLTEAPEARQGLLRRLLGMELYRSMGTRARDRARVAEASRSALLEQQADRRAVTTEDVAHAAADLERLVSAQHSVSEAVELLESAQSEAETQRAIEARTQADLDALTALRVPAEAREFEKTDEKLHTRRDAARAAAEIASSALTSAAETVAGLPQATDLERTIELHTEASQLEHELSAARLVETELGEAVALASEATTRAASGLDELVAARDAARLRAGAVGLRDVLVIGDPCPVCEQTVEQLPTHDIEGELEKLDEAVDVGRREAEAVRSEQHAAEQRHVRAEAERRSIETRVDVVAKALVDAEDKSATEETLHNVRAAESALDDAREHAERQLAELQDVESAYAELDDVATALRQALTGARDQLAALDPPVPAEASITADWNDLVAWGKATRAAVKERLTTASREARAAEKTVTRQRRTVEKLLTPLLDGEAPDDPLAWLAAQVGRQESQIETLRAEQLAQERSSQRIESLHHEAAVAGELGRLLSARGFEQWLMADVMHTLAARATERLFELSSGAYSLLTDGTDFSIRDHRNAEETRSARTLSGGETFLASLALALALADNIADLAAEGAPSIESMFLDEGFGTLDTDTLDVVASTIEDLGAEGRMVGVVTHIRELADRIPVRFDVARTPNGSTVTRTTLD